MDEFAADPWKITEHGLDMGEVADLVADTAENLEPLELEGDPDLTEEERAEVARLWKAEVRRRCAEIDAGTARLVPADEVMAGIRQLIEEHRRG